jgi:Ser/Thr protein kinase RdoA (MazF antagonist)
MYSFPVVSLTVGGPALKTTLLTIDRQRSQIVELQEALRLSRGHQAQAEIKAFNAMVDVLAGNVPGLAARNVHPLREGSGAATRDVSNADGARCLRA